MLFSSLLFLLLYLPLVVVLSLPGNRRWQNGWLLFASLLFHAWGGFSYTLLLWASIGFNFLLGRRIEREQTAGRAAKKTLWLGVGLNLGLLVVFKYTVFFGENVNALLQLTRIPPFELPRIALPLGISFYTFQGLSYLIDVYRGEVRAQASLARLGLFISFFPQLIAGPIVRYRTFVDQLTERVRSWDRFAAGTERFIWGLSKKVLLANNFGRVADELFVLDSGSLSPAAAWTGLLCYSLQIYYDFSGYSDMAIGLGRLFGFELPENFNYPYAARSVRDFWRRWHITLGAWFRDYVYLPLGGSRVGSGRTYRNLLIVFVLTGLWHGAAWTFLLWGLWHGAC
ncbi:MAG: MBOAT family O-acyltransferase, partial [Saprospiraceae bacterium]